MTQLVAVGAVSAGAVAVYGVLGVLWCLRHRADRRAAANLHEVEIEPYHVVATARYPGGVLKPAAAALRLGGLITISPTGLMAVTVRGSDPAQASPEHPIEAALLEFFRGQKGAVALKELRWETELHRRCKSFLREQDARLPRWSGHKKDGIEVVAALTALLLSFYYAVELVFLGEIRPSGLGEVLLRLLLMVITGSMIAVPLVWFVLHLWPIRRDPFREHCAGLPPHPALKAMTENQRARLEASATYRTAWDREQERLAAYDNDSGGGY